MVDSILFSGSCRGQNRHRMYSVKFYLLSWLTRGKNKSSWHVADSVELGCIKGAILSKNVMMCLALLFCILTFCDIVGALSFLPKN